MSVTLTVLGVPYLYPTKGEVGTWGQEATGWAAAITTAMLSKSGGLFQLLADADFGSNFGIVSTYFKSRTNNIATAGALRLAHVDDIAFRNFDNSANLLLGVNASNQLEFEGVGFQTAITVSDTSTIDMTFTANDLSASIIAGSITNALISAGAAIARSKLAAGTASVVLVNDGSGVMGESTVTATELLNLAGSTVNIQDEFDAINTDIADIGSDISTIEGEIAALQSGKQDTITGAATTIVSANLTASRALQSSASGKVEVSAVTATELGYVSGVTSSIQTQLTALAASVAGKQDTITGAATTITSLDLTASRAVVSDGSGKVAVSAVTATELGYVSGVTSSIQTQLNSAAVNPMSAIGQMIYGGASGTPTALAVGTANQMLRSNAGAAPTWVSTLLMGDGLLATPAYSFASDPNTGIYHTSNADQFALVTNSLARLTIDNNAVTSNLGIATIDGTNSNPALYPTLDPNTGIYFSAADEVAITTGGTQRFRVTSSLVTTPNPIYAPVGSITTPTYSFNGETNTGAYRKGSAKYNIVAGGVDSFEINANLSGGQVNIGPASIGAVGGYGIMLWRGAFSPAMAFKSTDTTGGMTSCYFMNGVDTVCGSISNTLSAGGTTTYGTTSDGRRKDILEDFDALAMIAQMNPVQYKWKGYSDAPAEFGFIAQELNEVLPQAVAVPRIDPNGENPLEIDCPLKNPWQVDYGKLTGVLTKAIQEQQEIIQELKDMIDLLLARVEALEA